MYLRHTSWVLVCFKRDTIHPSFSSFLLSYLSTFQNFSGLREAIGKYIFGTVYIEEHSPISLVAAQNSYLQKSLLLHFTLRNDGEQTG